MGALISFSAFSLSLIIYIQNLLFSEAEAQVQKAKDGLMALSPSLPCHISNYEAVGKMDVKRAPGCP